MPRPRSSRSDPRIQLICEWKGCNKSNFGDNVDLYNRHVVSHAERELRSKKLEQLCCQWSGCESEKFTSIEKFILHVNYHGFHFMLMSLGSLYVQDLSKKYGRELECKNSKSNRTMLPILPERFVCHWMDCEESFLEVELFYEHVYEHSNDLVLSDELNDQMICEWSECLDEFKTLTLLRNHLRSHAAEKEIACPTCGYMFVDKQKFKDHILRQVQLKPEDLPAEPTPGPSTGPFQCDHCQQLFVTYRLLEEHRRNISIKYVCSECGFLATGPDVLKKHVTYRHTDVRPFPCQFCDLSFKLRRDLRKHLSVHDTDKFFKCTQCPFSARQPETLNSHVRKVHENEKVIFKCHLCETECTRGNNLSRHLTRVHGLTPPPGMVRFKYTQDPSDKIYRFVDTRMDKLLPDPELWP